MPLSPLLGPDGRPIDRDRLFERAVAGPTLTGVRTPDFEPQAAGLTPARLARILREAAEGDAQAYLELAEDIEERDPHYVGVLATRKRSVAQLPIRVEAVSDDPGHVAHAGLVRAWLRRGILQDALFDILDAIGKGFSVVEVDWSAVPMTGGLRHLPSRLAYRPQRWFQFDPLGETLLLRDGTIGTPLAPHKFVLHKSKTKSGATIRSGLARVACWAWMLKAFTGRDWAIFVQNHGQPVRVGRYDPTTSEADRTVLWRAVANIAGDCAAIIPKGMEIEFIETKAADKSGDLYLARVNHLDQQISKLVLGQTTTTDAVSGGHAVAQEHRQVQEDIERDDAITLSATLTRQLVHHIVAFNFGPQPEYPVIVIGRPDEVPIAAVVDALAKLGDKGLVVETSELRDRLGFAEPAPGADVIGTRRVLDAPPPSPALFARAALAPDDDRIEALVGVAAAEAAEPFDALLGRVRATLEGARDLADALARLDRLALDPTALGRALARHGALGYLVGRADAADPE